MVATQPVKDQQRTGKPVRHRGGLDRGSGAVSGFGRRGRAKLRKGGRLVASDWTTERRYLGKKTSKNGKSRGPTEAGGAQGLKVHRQGGHSGDVHQEQEKTPKNLEVGGDVAGSKPEKKGVLPPKAGWEKNSSVKKKGRRPLGGRPVKEVQTRGPSHQS